MSDAQVRVADNPALERYELTVDGQAAGHLQYRDRGGRRILVHTQVDRAYAGQGLGGKLARAALEDLRRRGMPAVARCPFVRAWVQRHPEYGDIARVAARREGDEDSD
ncbi:MAG TPA: GNAT family N-acetyltransferase [candidate division Zixibacteria bacterium]|nr:GNAT family N-acetyltransferase [candidate division Zixibacteria bacterium]